MLILSGGFLTPALLGADRAGVHFLDGRDTGVGDASGPAVGDDPATQTADELPPRGAYRTIHTEFFSDGSCQIGSVA